MANLYNKNIGINYKGILNLDSTINTPLDTTLRSITDGMGVASVLNLSTTQVNVGGGTSLGRLVVRGDGTNPIARFDTSAGGFIFQVLNTGLFWGNGDGGQGGRLQGGGSGLFYIGQDVYNYGSMPNWISFNAGTGILVSGVAGAYMPSDGFFGIIRTFSNDASQAAFTQNQDYKFNNHRYTINNTRTSTGTATGLFLNATETALNGMTHNLMDLQKGSVSQFLVNNIGGLSLGSGSTNTQLVINSTGSLAGIYSPAYSPNSTELLTMRNFATGALQIQFNFTSSTNPIIKLGGTTNLFPAIKRNGAAIDFRLADDSAPCDINASKGFFTTTIGEPAIRGQNTGNTGTDSVMRLTNTVTNSVLHFGAAGLLLGGTNPNLKVGNTGANVPSAIVEIISTTQGFLPPRMTTTQINAIATPAEGLVVYNTTISHLCIYQGGVWTKVNHSPM